MSNKNELKVITGLMPDNNFLFYHMGEDGRLVEKNLKFEINNGLLKFSNGLKKIKEYSLSGIYIEGLEEEYDSLVSMSKDIELILEFGEHKYKKPVKVNALDFIRKEGDLYIFYISLPVNTIKDHINECIDKIIAQQKNKLLLMAENDDI